MKKIFTLLAVVFIAAAISAQAPQKMSYQAVIRNTEGNLVTEQEIGMQISILQGSADGTVVYTETQTPLTNKNGLVSIEIGGEAGFADIDWSDGPWFIRTETAPSGGTNYTITGTSQLLSVPYAFHAKTAETISEPIVESDPVFGASVASGITATDTTNWNNKQEQLTAGTGISIVGNTISATGDGSSNDFFLGQDTLGGIVFYIYLDQNGDQRGLIVSKTETVAQWQNTGVATNATRSWDGAYNMNLMSDSPAKDWVISNFSTEWYLPSIDELSILWHNRFHVNKALNDASATLLSSTFFYWSSTENYATVTFSFDFWVGHATDLSKASFAGVRAVRAF